MKLARLAATLLIMIGGCLGFPYRSAAPCNQLLISRCFYQKTLAPPNHQLLTLELWADLVLRIHYGAALHNAVQDWCAPYSSMPDASIHAVRFFSKTTALHTISWHICSWRSILVHIVDIGYDFGQKMGVELVRWLFWLLQSHLDLDVTLSHS